MKISLVSMPVQDPIAAHEIYTTKLGFISKEFDADTSIAMVVSAQDPDGTTLFLEPCKDTFAESYQKAAFDANLPVMIFSVQDVAAELKRLKAVGVKLRPELDRPEWGLLNLFEDGCGNLLMIEEASP